MKENTTMMKMKKFLAAALALTMVLALAACGSGNSSADTNTASGSAEGKTVVTVATFFHFGHHAYQSKWKIVRTFPTLIQHCSLSRIE